MVKRFFLDTNVIVHHIIFDKLSKREDPIKKGTPPYERYETAYKFIKKIITEKDSNVYFISLLVSGELCSALLDEYKCHEMYKGGIPLSSWNINKNHIKLDGEKRLDLAQAIVNFESNNVCEANEEADKEENKNKIWRSWDVYNFPLIYEFGFDHDLKSHDSILLSTAMFNTCDYFITLDKKLTEIGKLRNLVIINPQQAMEILNNEAKKKT